MNNNMIQPLLVFSDFSILILRVVLGIVMVVHSLPKIKNLKGTAASFEGMGFRPGAFWAVVAVFVEFVGGLGLILGFLTQFFALLVALQFAVILIKLKLKPGARLAGGYEFDLLIFAAALAIATLGSGALSLDNYSGLIIY
jgi:putative oxidoreductase